MFNIKINWNYILDHGEGSTWIFFDTLNGMLHDSLLISKIFSILSFIFYGYSINFLKPNSIIYYNAFLQKYVQAYGNFLTCSHAYLCVFYYDLRQMPYNKF